MFEPGSGAYPVPRDIGICWRGSPVGSRFFVTITQTAPETREFFNEYVTNEGTTCRFVETVAGDTPSVSYEAIARDDNGAIVARASYAFSTYAMPTLRSAPSIVSVSGPTSARLGDYAIITVRWKDADGNALRVSLTIEDADLAGTGTPFADVRDVSRIPVAKQVVGGDSAFGIVCRSVDETPHAVTITVTDAAGLTDSRTSSFKCLP